MRAVRGEALSLLPLGLLPLLLCPLGCGFGLLLLFFCLFPFLRQVLIGTLLLPSGAVLLPIGAILPIGSLFDSRTVGNDSACQQPDWLTYPALY